MTPKRRSKHRQPVVERIDATPETRKKLRFDVIARLQHTGQLRSEHILAAQEIRTVWEALTRGIFHGLSDTPHQPHMRAGASDPLDRLSEAEEIMWRTRYRPWTHEMATAVFGGAHVTRLQLVLDIVVDNYGLREVEEMYKMQRGTSATRHLKAALHRYAEIAGWN